MNNPSISLRFFGQTYMWLTFAATLILLLNGSLKQPEISEFSGRVISEKFTALSFGYLFFLVFHAIAVNLVFSYMAFMSGKKEKPSINIDNVI